MFTIGLTGGIGTGKSEVGRLLQALGATVVDGDKLGHEVYAANTEGLKAVVSAFGNGILSPTGEIDRAKLGALVFSDSAAMSKLTGIMWPRIAKLFEQRRAALAKQGVKVVVLEAAVLLEAKWQRLADEVWVVAADEAKIIERLQARNGLSKEAALARINSQMPQSERVKHAQVVIENNGGLDALRERVNAACGTRIQNRVGEHVHS